MSHPYLHFLVQVKFLIFIEKVLIDLLPHEHLIKCNFYNNKIYKSLVKCNL